MISTHRRSLQAALAVAALLVTAPVWADPPGRVARLNYMKGSVSFRPASLDEWAPATLNYPVTTGDHLWTDTSSWAELHVGSSAIRLAPSTAFAFLNLDDNTTQIRLSEGAVDVRVRNVDGSGEFEIDTPAAAVMLTRPGVYRVDVLPNGGSTRVTVRVGQAAVTGDGADFSVRDGETAALYGADDGSHEIFRAAAPDSWERWCRSRDEREDRAGSLRYVSYEMTGYEDLDEYGTWTSLPDYGWAWQPRVAVGWTPYRYGQWRWVGQWGWTWVDDAAWGFAPFHYGRWACMRGSWYWVPGSYMVRPVYSPALVAFFGGDNWGFSVGFGRQHVGWFPLAPGELWWPHYHASHTYIRNVNITNVRVANINFNNYDPSRGSYVNRAIAGAATAVPRDAFLGGRAVARDAVSLDARAVMRAQVAGGPGIAPRQDSVLGSRGGAVRRPPSGALDRTVVARAQPPAAAAPFAAQERAIQASGGRPIDENAMARLRSESGDRGLNAPVRVAGARGGGFRGQPGRADSANRESSPSGAFGGGTATRRGGERNDAQRVRPEATEPAAGAVNDRPSWARPRGGSDAQSTNPRYGGDTSSSGAGSAGGARGGEAGPRYGGERGNARDGAASGNDRPASGRAVEREGSRPSGRDNARPSGGDNARPSGGDSNTRPSGGTAGGVRSRGGESRPAPTQESKPAEGARPRAGGRGGDTAASYDPSSRQRAWSNDRPSSSYRASRSTESAAPSGSSARPSAQAERSWSASRPTYSTDRSTTWPSAREARPSPQYRAVPETRSAPQYQSIPQTRSMPQSRSVPEARSMPEYRPRGAESQPRSYSPPSQPRSSAGGGGAVYRGGGGDRGSAGSGAPRGQQGGGSNPRGGARNRGGD